MNIKQIWMHTNKNVNEYKLNANEYELQLTRTKLKNRKMNTMDENEQILMNMNYPEQN